MTKTEDGVFSPTLKLKCDAVLNKFFNQESPLSFLSLSTSDGYILAHSNPVNNQFSSRRISAMAASFAGISQELAKETSHSSMEGSIIECNTGFLVCRLVKTNGIEAVLLGVFNKDSNHGMALWTLKNVAKSISDLLEVYN